MKILFKVLSITSLLLYAFNGEFAWSKEVDSYNHYEKRLKRLQKKYNHYSFSYSGGNKISKISKVSPKLEVKSVSLNSLEDHKKKSNVFEKLLK